MTAARTPGPWQLSESFVTNDGQRAVMTVGDDRVRVALVDRRAAAKRGKGYEVECPERDANARLIAAAPDLFDALEKLTSIFTDLPAARNYQGVVTQARKALAKATT